MGIIGCEACASDLTHPDGFCRLSLYSRSQKPFAATDLWCTLGGIPAIQGHIDRSGAVVCRFVEIGILTRVGARVASTQRD
jgi:hypothetical protein